MTSKCVIDKYEHATAEERRRYVQRFLRLRCKIEYCHACDAYHVIYDDQYGRIDQQNLAILQKIAMGMRDSEIAADLGLTLKQVEHAVNRLSRLLNAMSRANLVAITIALGIINPSSFIAEMK